MRVRVVLDCRIIQNIWYARGLDCQRVILRKKSAPDDIMSSGAAAFWPCRARGEGGYLPGSCPMSRFMISRIASRCFLTSWILWRPDGMAMYATVTARASVIMVTSNSTMLNPPLSGRLGRNVLFMTTEYWVCVAVGHINGTASMLHVNRAAAKKRGGKNENVTIHACGHMGMPACVKTAFGMEASGIPVSCGWFLAFPKHER